MRSFKMAIVTLILLMSCGCDQQQEGNRTQGDSGTGREKNQDRAKPAQGEVLLEGLAGISRVKLRVVAQETGPEDNAQVIREYLSSQLPELSLDGPEDGWVLEVTGTRTVKPDAALAAYEWVSIHAGVRVRLVRGVVVDRHRGTITIYSDQRLGKVIGRDGPNVHAAQPHIPPIERSELQFFVDAYLAANPRRRGS